MSGIATTFEFIFALVLMLGVLVTVHEFGHFIAAKLCGVRVLKFSIGFGSPIGFGRFRLAWERSGTEYVIAWLPLGGFVKMLGENPGEDDLDAQAELPPGPGTSLNDQPVWQKLFIVFAGPAMNLLLPVAILTGILWVGIDRAATVVGNVEPASPAAAAGLLPGDKILSLDGEPIAWWDDLDEAIRERPGESVRLEIERDGERFTETLEVTTRDGLDRLRLQSQVGWLGLQHSRQKPVLGVVSLTSAAARGGLQSGDRVTAVGDTEVEDWAGFAKAYAEGGSGRVALTVARPDPDAEPVPPTSEEEAAENETEHVVSVEALGSTEALGVIPAVVLVAAVNPEGAAAAAGLEAGDLIVAVDGQPIGSFFTFQETVLGSGGRALEIQYARGGETRVVSVAPKKSVLETGGIEEEVFLIGIQGQNAILRGAVGHDQERNPLTAVPRAVTMTAELTGLYLQGLQRIITGDISRKSIGGPIEIARQSHLALQAGWDRFLNLLMFISINLGVLNLLPIPILDGGQAVLFTIEGVKRGPLSLRTREFVQQVGLILILALMGFAFWNDLSRNWSKFFEWVTG